MQQSSSFLFSSFFGCFLTKEEQRSARTCTRSWNWSAESKVYCRAGAALHCSHVCLCGIFQIFVVCWSEGWIIDKQVDIVKRHCQSAVDMITERSNWLTHTLSLFCFCGPVTGLVTSKMSHGVNNCKSCKLHHSACREVRVFFPLNVLNSEAGACYNSKRTFCPFAIVTQHVCIVAQGDYASEVVRNSQNTAWRCRKKLCIFFFWISHCMLAVGALETWTWWPHLAKFCLDVLIVEFSESDSFSRIWSHGEREREREGGGGSRGSEIEQNLALAWTSLSVAFPTICMQGRDKRDSNVSWSATSQRRVTKRTVAYRPAVSIPLSRSYGIPTCLYLASPLSDPYERRPMASRKEQLSSLFFVAWTTRPLHEKLSMGSEGPSSLKETQIVKKYFCVRSTPGSPPAGLKETSWPHGR